MGDMRDTIRTRMAKLRKEIARQSKITNASPATKAEIKYNKQELANLQNKLAALEKKTKVRPSWFS